MVAVAAKLSFPPLANKFNPSGTVGTWPGAEFTRRTKLKTRCVEEYSSQFLDEMRGLLGERGFDAYQTALQPSISRKLSRGKPPEEGGASVIQPRARLVRDGGELSKTLSSSTTMLSGHASRARVLELTHTPWGDVPSHMFDNKPAEPVASLDEWFLTYGRPTPSTVPGSKNMYTVSQTRQPARAGLSRNGSSLTPSLAWSGVPKLEQASMRRALTTANNEERVRHNVRLPVHTHHARVLQLRQRIWRGDKQCLLSVCALRGGGLVYVVVLHAYYIGLLASHMSTQPTHSQPVGNNIGSRTTPARRAGTVMRVACHMAQFASCTQHQQSCTHGHST